MNCEMNLSAAIIDPHSSWPWICQLSYTVRLAAAWSWYADLSWAQVELLTENDAV